ncbi:MAG: [FeFe] hydrogenase H-cluster radical SAM maturase HydE [Ruminococcaceae bacterium]|nr:[FeFe] hydrogenase H-cluster radical SAM maturase HydE [Oscillospiraceae bacterium]
MTTRAVAERLVQGDALAKAEILCLLQTDTENAFLRIEARKRADSVFGKTIYLRGLVEISSYCKNNCLYCGLRRSAEAARYRLSDEDIFAACAAGYEDGIRTFVLQGGEDGYFTDERVCRIVSGLKQRFPEAAVTLSLGERSRESYARLREAGADRYLLRHETASPDHYEKLHPPEMTLSSRMECLRNLKELGYQVGAGFMVGSPYQTVETIAEDLLFLQEFRPHMIGIGPFIPQSKTPFAGFPAGRLEDTLKLLSILRLMHPRALLPATTALATLSPDGREEGIRAGANVVMPNLSPPCVRGKYAIYDNKAFETIDTVRKRIQDIGYEIKNVRGDYQ